MESSDLQISTNNRTVFTKAEIVNVNDFILPKNFPEFSLMNHDKIQEILEDCYDDCHISIWGKYQKRGVWNLAAHKLKMRYSQMGQMAGESVENAKGGSPSLPLQTGNDEDYMTTQYGREYLYLRNKIPIGGIIASLD